MKKKPQTITPKNLPVDLSTLGVTGEEIAAALIQIQSGMRELMNTRLSRKAIVVLVHHQSKIPQKTIEIILNNLEDIAKDWMKKATA